MRFPHSLVLAAACVAFLPTGVALSQVSGSGGGQGGVGTPTGSSGPAVGGGPPAGAVGGGAPAGPVGGGAATNTAAPTSPATKSPATGANPPTTGGVIGGYTGVGNPPGTNNNEAGGTQPSPSISGQPQPPVAPAEVRGIAGQAPNSSTGLAKPAEDGVSTKIVPARPCSTAAQETDGTTTCVGIPSKR
jgi:hypothetical protein